MMPVPGGFMRRGVTNGNFGAELSCHPKLTQTIAGVSEGWWAKPRQLEPHQRLVVAGRRLSSTCLRSFRETELFH